MSDDQRSVRPYKTLGARLKRLREGNQESLAEVSGAVEIEIASLERLEGGDTRPAEDILLLLISHFDMKDEEATKLWKLAGYQEQDLNLSDDEEDKSVIVMPNENRVHYTDMVHVLANDYGVVVNFMQSAGLSGQPMIISRLGMSKDHVRSVIDILKRSLEQSEPKALPAPKKTQKIDRPD